MLCDLLLFWLFGSVLRATLFAILHTLRIQCTANDMIANTWQILDTTTSNKNDRVFLQVVTLTRDIRGYFHLIRQANTGDLPES